MAPANFNTGKTDGSRHEGAGGANRTVNHHIKEMEQFDYNAPADVFGIVGVGTRRKPMTFRRFSTGAEALKYLVEIVGVEQLRSTVLETDEARFDATDILALYESTSYPLPRC